MSADIQTLVEQARRGDKPAFGELYQMFDAKLRSFCARFLTKREDVEDAMGETSERALSAIVRFNGDASFATWLYAIARNVCLDILEKRRRILSESLHDAQGNLRHDVPDNAPSPEQLAFWQQILMAIPVKGAAYKPPWDKTDYQIYLYHCQQGDSFREVAERLGMRESAVKQRFQRKIEPVLKMVAEEFGIPYVPKRDTSGSKGI